MFSGQGPQWFVMGRGLYKDHQVFREAIDMVDSELRRITPEFKELFPTEESTSWTVASQILCGTPDDEQFVNRADVAQILIFSVQFALASLLKHCGIEPDFVVGHSLGEVSAALVSGVLDFRSAVYLIKARGTLQNKASKLGGRMIAVNCDSALEVCKKNIIGLEVCRTK